MNNRGFSIVEILIAVALMGGLALVMMNMTDQQNKNQTTAEVNFEKLEFRRKVANLLAVKKSCEATFVNFKIGEEIPNLKNAAGVEVVVKDQVYGNNSFKTKRFSTRLIRDNGDGTYLIELVMELEKIKQNALSTKNQFQFGLTVSAADISSPITACMTNEGLWALNSTNDIYNTNAENVGIGTAEPGTKLEVAGGMRPGSETEVTACGLGKANGEGVQRYNYTTHTYEYCNGTGWVPMGGGGAFGGSYELATFSGWRCRYVNPVTGACNCPPGYRASLSGQAYRWSKWDSTIYICYKP